VIGGRTAVTHESQHFVPRFLLEKWHTPPDDKLTAFRRANCGLVHHRYKAKSVAKERHLYSMGRSGPTPDVQVEREFWGPHVDEPAAKVHAKMLALGVSALTVEDKKDWSPFLVSLMLRGPTMMAHLRKRGREILSAGLDEAPNDYLAMRGDEPEASLREWVEKRQPDILDDIGVMTLPELTFSERLNLAVVNVTWAIRLVDKARFDLLMSDRPLILIGTLEANFLLVLPISPQKAFFAFNRDETFANIRSLSHDDFVMRTNRTMVAAAERYVYATNARQESIIKKHLRQAEVADNLRRNAVSCPSDDSMPKRP